MGMPVMFQLDTDTIRKFGIWAAIYGIVLIILGALAIIMPGVATLATGLTIGWLLLIAGIVGVIAVLTSGMSAPGFWWNLLTAILYVVAGGAILWRPVAGVVTLTIVLAAYLLATGVLKAIMALDYRRTIPKAWGWMLLSALVDIVLGVLILMGLPGTALWVLGLLVGINLLFSGVALVVAAMESRKISTTAARHGA
jgi:uncharacterized membrane protein HdeD (DUF308 family)